MSDRGDALGPNHRMVEIGVALATAAFALIVMGGSLQVGVGWDVDGPMAGFFPFYVSLMILGASFVNFVQIWIAGPNRKLFADWQQLLGVAKVVVPTAIYVALIPRIGLYLSSTLLIAVFMKWLGRYGGGVIALIAIGTPVVIFLVFEKWFLVPLPKGPIEAALGF